jgi:hypothetical protein
MRFLTLKHHLHEAIPLQSPIAALQIPLQLRQPRLQSQHESSYSHANRKPGAPNTMA